MNDKYLDFLTILSVALTLVNYKENLEQSTSDDVIEELNQKQSAIVSQLQLDLDKQNAMLQQILQRLETRINDA